MIRPHRKKSAKSSAPFIEPLENRQLLSTVSLDFSGGAGGIAGSGFASVLPTSGGKGLISSDVTVSGGKLLVTTTSGDLSRNNQDNALDLALNAAGNFSVQTRLTALPFSKNWQNGGVFVGINQDNYVKLVVGFSGATSLQLANETGAVFTSPAFANFSFAGVSTLDLRLTGTLSNKVVVAQYRVNSSSDSAWITLGQVTNPNVFSTSAKAGIVTTSLATTAVTVPFDSFSATGADVVTLPPPPPPPPPPPSTPPPTTTGTFTLGAITNASKLGGSQAESEIAINPTNPNNVVVSAVNQNSGDAALLISRSFDGGKTWTVSSLGAAQDHLSGSTSRVDPHLAFDAFGNLYVAYEVAASSSEIRVIVARSSDGGATFTASAAVSGQGLNIDYPLIATGPDATDLSKQTVWISYIDTGIKRIRIVGARSTGLGNLSSFTAPVTVSDNNATYGALAVGPLGQVVAAWQTGNGQTSSKMSLDVDADGLGTALTWGKDKLIGTTNVGGFDKIPAQPNRSIDANLNLVFDRSTGPARGRLYLAYADEPVDESNNTDIFLRYSDNLGTSWSTPLKVNDDGGSNSQFLPALAVDQSTGNLALTWRDARNSAANNTSELWGTVSLDHGVSVNPNVKLSAMSNQAGAGVSGDDLDYGDYQGVAFANGKFIAVWTDNSNSTGDNANGAGGAFDLYTVAVTVG